MKVKVSISMDEATLKNIEKSLDNELFRNKSHFIEIAAKKYLREVKDVRKL